MSTTINLESSKISIFPTPNREATYQPQARLITEFNLINIVNRLVDKESFVISYKNNEIIFNIYGYWIKADLTGLSITGDLYARIQVTASEGSDFTELQGTDEKDTSGSESKYTYRGVTFITGDNIVSFTDSDGWHSLKLLEKVGDTWQVPEDSQVKFATGAKTRSITIDDGDLDLA